MFFVIQEAFLSATKLLRHPFRYSPRNVMPFEQVFQDILDWDKPWNCVDSDPPQKTDAEIKDIRSKIKTFIGAIEYMDRNHEQAIPALYKMKEVLTESSLTEPKLAVLNFLLSNVGTSEEPETELQMLVRRFISRNYFDWHVLLDDDAYTREIDPEIRAKLVKLVGSMSFGSELFGRPFLDEAVNKLAQIAFSETEYSLPAKTAREELIRLSKGSEKPNKNAASYIRCFITNPESIKDDWKPADEERLWAFRELEKKNPECLFNLCQNALHFTLINKTYDLPYSLFKAIGQRYQNYESGKDPRIVKALRMRDIFPQSPEWTFSLAADNAVPEYYR